MGGAIPLLPLHAFMTFTGTTLHLPSLISSPKTRENGYSTWTRLRSNSEQFDARNAGISWVLCLWVRILLLSLYCYFDFKKWWEKQKGKFCKFLIRYDAIRWYTICDMWYTICDIYDMICYMIWYMIWYIWYDIWYMLWYMIYAMVWYMIRYDIRYVLWYDMIWYDMIYLLIAILLTPGGSSTVHIYTQTIHRTTQLTTLVGKLSGIRRQSGQNKINDEITS